MARIALTIAGEVAGAIIGGLLGGPAGAALGFSIGGTLGGIAGALAFPNVLPTNFGPRLNDKQVTAATDGEPIPFGFGGFRIGGNIIYSSPINETKVTQTFSSKGGPTQTSVTYTYSVDFAVAFCEGPADILRIWADSKLIYDVTGKGPVRLHTGVTDWAGTPQISGFEHIVLYKGDETQLPNPVMQADKGVALTPAYRGLCYAMFEKFPLADFGNRIPNIRAEISTGTTQSYIKDVYPPITTGNPFVGGALRAIKYPLVDEINRVCYFIASDQVAIEAIDLSVPTTQPLQAWSPNTVMHIGDQILDPNGQVECIVAVSGDAKTGATIPAAWPPEGIKLPSASYPVADNHVTWQDLGPGPEAITVLRRGFLDPRFGGLQNVTQFSSNTGMSNCVDGSGFIWGAAELNSVWHLVKFDPVLFKAVAVCALPTGIGAVAPDCLRAVRMGSTNLIYATCNKVLYVINADNPPPSVVNGNIAVPFVPAGWSCAVPYITINPLTGIAYFGLFSGSGVTYSTAFMAVDPRGAGSATMTVIQTAANVSDTGVPAYLLVDTSDNSLIGLCGTGPGGSFGANPTVYKIDIASGAILARLGVAGVQQYDGLAATFRYAAQYNGVVPENGIIHLWNYTLTSVRYIDTKTMTETQTVGSNLWFPNSGVSFDPVSTNYDSLTNALLLTGQGALGTYSGLGYRMFLDRKAISSQSVGSIVTALLERADVTADQIDTTGMNSTQCLGYCVTRTSDCKAALQPLCMAYFFDIIESDYKLVAVPRGGTASVNIPENDLGISADKHKLQETITQEQDLPKLISVCYTDPALNYQQGKQHKYRKAKVKKTKNQSVLQLPITMNSDTAAQIANKYLATIWGERNQYGIKLWKSSYLTIDPSDVIQFTYEGMPFQSRVSKHSTGQNKVVEITGVSEDARQYLSGLTGADNLGFNPGTISASGPTMLFLMDIPLLQDTDASFGGTTGYYWALASPSGIWPGGVLLTSADNASYTQVDSNFVQATYGIVSAATPAPDSPWDWDFTTSINVRMAKGTLSSTTQLAVLNGANAFILGQEVMQFQTATLQADGSYNLTNLLRGRRGTDYACINHLAGETLIMLIPDAIQHTPVTTNLIGLLRYYKALTIGNIISSATPTQMTLLANDLRPYAPAVLNGVWDAGHNLIMSWVRRTRVGGAWLDGTGTVPLSESIESYDLDIMLLNGGGKNMVSYYCARQADIGRPLSNQPSTIVASVSPYMGEMPASTGFCTISPFTIIWEDGHTASYLGTAIGPAFSFVGNGCILVYDPTRGGDAYSPGSVTYSVQEDIHNPLTVPNLPGYFLIGISVSATNGSIPCLPGGSDVTVRQLKGLTAPGYPYIYADQFADFGYHPSANPGYIRVKVYQNSAIAGRGFAAQNATMGL